MLIRWFSESKCVYSPHRNYVTLSAGPTLPVCPQFASSTFHARIMPILIERVVLQEPQSQTSGLSPSKYRIK